MAIKRRVKGDRAFRKLLARFPDAARDEMVGQVLDPAGNELLSSMLAQVPRRRGRLAAGLSKKLFRRTMRLQVGFIGRKVNRELFYGRIVEFGRKGRSVIVRARRTPSGGTAKPYRLRIKAMPPRHFIFSPRTDLRRAIAKRINAFWDRALMRAASGASDE